jgi:hypothetical protein
VTNEREAARGVFIHALFGTNGGRMTRRSLVALLTLLALFFATALLLVPTSNAQGQGRTLPIASDDVYGSRH